MFRISAVPIRTFKAFVEGLQQQAAVIAHSQKGVANLFGRNIRIPVTETLVLFTDIGLDIFQLLVDTLRIVPLIVIRPMTGT